MITVLQRCDVSNICRPETTSAFCPIFISGVMATPGDVIIATEKVIPKT